MFDANLELKYSSSELPIGINYFWLRDHCRCTKCYNIETNQRTLDILNVPLDIEPHECKITDDEISIQCMYNAKTFLLYH